MSKVIQIALILLATIIPSVSWSACVGHQLHICEDASLWSTRQQHFSGIVGACGAYTETVWDGRSCFGWGYDDGNSSEPPPENECSAPGSLYKPTVDPVIVTNGLGFSPPSVMCVPTSTPGGGCLVNVTNPGGTSVQFCNNGSCYWSAGGMEGTYTGGTCNSNTPQGNGSTPEPGSPPGPIDPIDPEEPPPGCDSMTDPDCGPLETTPPGCTKYVRTEGTGVKEVIVCRQTTCGPSVCKTTTTTTTNTWGDVPSYTRGDPPSNRGTETEEKTQPRNPSPGGGTPGAGPGNKDADGDGFLDGDIDRNGTCDINCNGPAPGGGTPGAGPGNQDADGDGFLDGDVDRNGTCDINCNGPGGGGGGGEGSFCSENPDSPLCEEKGACKEGDEGTIGCMNPGSAPTDEVPKGEISLGLKSSPVTFGSGGGGCPAPTTVSIFGHAVTLIDPSAVCSTISSIVRPIVLMLAAFAAAMIIFRGVEV